MEEWRQSRQLAVHEGIPTLVHCFWLLSARPLGCSQPEHHEYQFLRRKFAYLAQWNPAKTNTPVAAAAASSVPPPTNACYLDLCWSAGVWHHSHHTSTSIRLLMYSRLVFDPRPWRRPSRMKTAVAVRHHLAVPYLTITQTQPNGARKNSPRC